MKLTFLTDENKCINASCNPKVLGKKFGKKFKVVNSVVQNMKFDELASIYKSVITVKNHGQEPLLL